MQQAIQEELYAALWRGSMFVLTTKQYHVREVPSYTVSGTVVSWGSI